MSAPESSPLRALDALYERLAADPSYELSRPGYSAQKVSFCVLLNPDGSLAAIQDERDSSGKRPVPRLLSLPGQAKSPGQGLNPCFLWDNSAYLLGYKPEDEKPARTATAFAAFRDRHLALESNISDPAFAAVCTFLRSWSPTRALEYKTQLDEFAATGFGVFRIAGEHGYVHERKTIAAYWEGTQTSADDDITRGQCLITGEPDQPLARLIEPAIKSVAGAQSAGAKIVSFNCDSFTSYRPEHKGAQALVAPISQGAAFRHTTALNALLAGPQSRRHRIQIGDATTVFWTERPTSTENIFTAFLDGHMSDEELGAQDETLRLQLQTFCEVLRAGGGRDLGSLGDEGGTAFYVFGLSPNAARISVRFWLAGTVNSIIDRLRDHYAALRLVRRTPEREAEFPAAWLLLRQTARETKDIPPMLAGPFLRAVLTGSAYPSALPQAILNRIRADHDIGYLRACILKAFLNRNHDKKLPMSLDPSRPDAAYRLGRLFAALEKTQEDALPGLNATIRDRFYSAASATPAAVFPRLLRTYQHHLAKAAGERGVGLKINRERLVQEICGGLDAIPRHLGLEGQSLFAVGYYHQRQAFFAKSDDAPTPTPATAQ